MFLKLFSKKKRVPDGYIEYSKEDFESYFGISEDIALQVEKDYISLVNQSNNKFTELVNKSGRDLHSISNELVKRYESNKSTAGKIALFYANVSSSIGNQSKRSNLGITQCKWLGSACSVKSKDNSISHQSLDGKNYDCQKGILTPDGYILPGVALGCLCSCRVILPGLG
jgi:hypothetical protein